MNNERLSRYLSAILRHQAQNKGFTIDSKGFVPVNELIASNKNITLDQLQTIVQKNDKQRFELMNHCGSWFIRAVQGHSIPGIFPDLDLITDAGEIPIVVHGTNLAAYEKIKATGLNRMGRNHIHFAHGTSSDHTVISGMRSTAKVYIYINDHL